MDLAYLDRKLSLLNIFEIISPIECWGIAHIPGALHKGACATLARNAELLDFVQLPENNQYGVEQHMASAQDVAHVSPFKELAAEVGNWLSCRFGLIAGWEHMRPTFDDVAIQRYESCPIGISPHKDSNARVLLIALVSLSGTASFATCRERSLLTTRKVFATGPGDLVLMRAPGFASPEDIERPFHSVYNIVGPRHVAALRVRR